MIKANRQYIEAIVKGLSLDSGVTIQEGKGWHTDIHKKVLTYDMNDLIDLEISLIRGLILHELGHVMYTRTETTTPLQKKYPKAMQALYNTYEDLRIDNKTRETYGAYGSQALENIYVKCSVDNAYNIPQHKDEIKELDKIALALLALESSKHAYTSKGTEKMSWASNELVNSLQDESKKHYQELLSSSSIPSLYTALDTDKIKEIIDNEVYPILKDEIEAYEESAGKEEGKEEGKEDNTSGSESTESKESKDSSKESKEGSEGTTEGSEGTTGKEEGKKEEKEEKEEHKPHGIIKHMQELKQGKAGSGDSVTTYDSYQPYYLHSLPGEEEIKSLLLPVVNTVSQQLKDILIESKAVRYTGNHLSGKLLSRNMYKIATGEDRIFSKRTNSNTPDYAITLVLDESGSMKINQRNTYVYMAGVLLQEICKQLNFPLRIIKYNNYVIKIDSMEEYRKFRGGDNNDYEAIQNVLENIDKSRDNIVFILTDGKVCNDPKEPLQELESMGIPVLAIGIGLTGKFLDELRAYYPHTVEASDLEALPNILIAELSKLIHR